MQQGLLIVTSCSILIPMTFRPVALVSGHFHDLAQWSLKTFIHSSVIAQKRCEHADKLGMPQATDKADFALLL